MLTLDRTWSLAKLWYENRRDPGWQRPNAEEATAAFASLGLTGDFWRLA